MSDRELIIGLLKRVEQRRRANRFLKSSAAALTLSLLIPVSFKLVDLITPFRGRTVGIVLAVWAAASIGFILWKLRGRESLAEVAARVDHRADLHDQIKTAYWFIQNPSHSEWVDAQLRRAARNAGSIDLDRLYPRFIPKSSYLAVALVFLLGALNFVPLPWNHNWLYLQAAPAFSFSDAEKSLLRQAEALLKKAEALENSSLAAKVEDVVNKLQEGEISMADAIRQLDQLQQELEEGNLDVASINQGLDEIADDLGQARPLESAAEAMARHDLKEAADEIQRAGQRKLSDAEAKEVRDKLQQAAENGRPGLQELSKDLQDAADALGREDEQSFQAALQKTAQELDKLSQKMQSQQLKNEASQRLQDVENSLQQRQQQQQNARDANGQKGQGQKKDGQAAGQGQPQAPGGGAQQQGQAGAPEEGVEAGAPGGDAEGGGDSGGGQYPSGTGGPPQPLYGQATKLDVQLEQEKLLGESADGAPKPDKTEEASKQERSKLDYRNVPSDLTPGQKELLNQDRLPWEHRQLIKQYFEEIRRQQKP